MSGSGKNPLSHYEGLTRTARGARMWLGAKSLRCAPGAALRAKWCAGYADDAGAKWSARAMWMCNKGASDGGRRTGSASRMQQA